ncbi:hypothetical protein DRQ50_04840 [bacterium]|nr:MAG: hypothetical protein DRQ50_04840 [bacterium]
MTWRREWQPLLWIVGTFLAVFHLPVGGARFDGAVHEALQLVRWYAREHVLLCLVPAFFIAGAISVFVSQGAVMRYLGAGARRVTAYAVAAVSGGILAVCSCTVLPLFAGIHRMGAGLGPATAFLYAGPAINVLAIVLTARVLGVELGIARAVGAVLFSVLIGLGMELVFRGDQQEGPVAVLPDGPTARHLGVTVAPLAALVALLIFATWGSPAEAGGVWAAVAPLKWWLTGAAALALGVALALWYGLGWLRLAGITAVAIALTVVSGEPLLVFSLTAVAFATALAATPGELSEWFEAAWGFAKLILPMLLIGELVAGFLLGRPGHEGIIPAGWVARAVGGNGLGATLFAAVAGAFMYFATLTEVPILQGLMGAGMGSGPALALLLAGPALSLPSILVLRSVMGWKKTGVFILLVVVMSTVAGLVYGNLIAR